MNQLKNKKDGYDVLVVGGGPAGMMAAGRAAEAGARVLLVEKNDSLGKKLLITGGGRCNVTNAEFDARKLVDKLGDKGKFLFSSFSQFGVPETFDFFHLKNMPTKVEAEKRAFPVSNKAQSVWDTLVTYLQKNNVEVLSDTPVTGLVKKGSEIVGVQIGNKKILRAKKYILATGGKSRPETGSTGEGFLWLKELGHKVIEPDVALVPIETKDGWVKQAQGVSFSNVRVSVFQNNAQQFSKTGKILFTHFGLSGPLILNMSKDIGELIKYGEVKLSLDLFSDLDHLALDAHIRTIFETNQNKKLKNVFGLLVPPKMVPVILSLTSLDQEQYVNKISKESRLALGRIFKQLFCQVHKLLGTEKAIVTSGGLALEEIDFKTMQSKLYPNLYCVGDVLNFDRPSGGYSLQICWTTGYIAGDHASKK
ncbi:aminoacetone oxidase family FAD-binding enzyme [Patescibacteria group bacterium]|nr:MAG: aminoacetone oxidase family FAD-binding enzyme [Patescibacteria group bacterium]